MSKSYYKEKILKIPSHCNGCCTKGNCPFSNYFMYSLFDDSKDPANDYKKLTLKCPCRDCLIKMVCIHGCEEFEQAEFDYTSDESDKRYVITTNPLVRRV